MDGIHFAGKGIRERLDGWSYRSHSKESSTESAGALELAGRHFHLKLSSGQEKLLLITFPHSSTPLELTILVRRRLSIFPPVFPCTTRWFSGDLLPRPLPVGDCLDLDSNFLSLQVLGPSQAHSQQIQIDRQRLYVSRLIESLGSAEGVALVFELIHRPAWPSRLFDIQGSFSPWLTHVAMLLPLRLRKFSPNRERAMTWAGATHLGYRAFRIQTVDYASHVRCSLTGSGLDSLSRGLQRVDSVG